MQRNWVSLALWNYLAELMDEGPQGAPPSRLLDTLGKRPLGPAQNSSRGQDKAPSSTRTTVAPPRVQSSGAGAFPGLSARLLGP